MEVEIKFGDRVKDTITGFEGFVTAKVEYITGCIQWEITPATLKDGVPQSTWWIDEKRVVLVSKAEDAVTSSPTGGPQDNHPPSSYVMDDGR